MKHRILFWLSGVTRGAAPNFPQPRMMDVVIKGKHYATEAATLVAQGYAKQGRGTDPACSFVFLFRTPKNDFFAECIDSYSGPDERRLVPIHDVLGALAIYQGCQVKKLSFQEVVSSAAEAIQ